MGVGDDATAKEDLNKLSVTELKRRIFWVGGNIPAGHLEKSDLVIALQNAKRTQGVAKAVPAAPSPSCAVAATLSGSVASSAIPEPSHSAVLKPSRSLPQCHNDIKNQEEVTRLHLLSEGQLKQRIQHAGHELPEGELGKHFLVALCRNALRNPKAAPSAPKPIATMQTEAMALPTEEEAELEPERRGRPTVGDKVQVMDSDLMKRYLPNSVGKVFRIIKDDGGSTPYKLSGQEAQHWFSETDIKWPEKARPKKTPPKPPDQPDQIKILQSRYGCLQGEVHEVMRLSADAKSWMLKSGCQVPKKHEGTGWVRAGSHAALLPPPPAEVPKGQSVMPAISSFAQLPHAPDEEASSPKVEESAPSPKQESSTELLVPTMELADDAFCKLSVGELKHRIREFGAQLLIGLSEKSELVSALQEAVRVKREKQETTLPVIESLPRPHVIGEEEVQTQMEELQTLQGALSVEERNMKEMSDFVGIQPQVTSNVTTSRASACQHRPYEVTSSDDDGAVAVEATLAVQVNMGASGAKRRRARRESCSAMLIDDEASPIGSAVTSVEPNPSREDITISDE